MKCYSSLGLTENFSARAMKNQYNNKVSEYEIRERERERESVCEKERKGSNLG